MYTRRKPTNLNDVVLTKKFVLQVAIKKMKKKYYSWEECINLREVKVIV